MPDSRPVYTLLAHAQESSQRVIFRCKVNNKVKSDILGLDQDEQYK